MNELRLYARIARLLAVLTLGALLGGWVGLLERLVRHDLMPLRQRLSRWFLARLSAALPFRVRLLGRPPEQPMLWVSNHVSWTDVPLLGCLAPLSFLSKAEVRSWPLAGWLAQRGGTLFIKRGAGESGLVKNQLLHHLRHQRSLLIFPEGTTTDGRNLRTFHSRLLASAVEAGVAVQPVAIRYLRAGEPDPIAPFIGEDDLLSHLLRLLRSDQGAVEIHLLPVLESNGLSRSELTRQAKDAISAQLSETSEDLPRAA